MVSAFVREAAADRLPDTCVIYGVSESSGSQGTTKTFTQRGTPKSCRLASLSGRELERAQQVAGEADLVVTLEANTVVYSTDRIIATNGETGDIFDIEVEHVVKRSREITRRVYGKDITPT